MQNFWDYSVWGFVNLLAVLLIALLLANLLKKSSKKLRASLIPTSVLAGLILLVSSIVFQGISGNNLWDTAFFGNSGQAKLESITYHCLALGFIATTLRTPENKPTKQRKIEIINTGITTVATYLLQAVIGLGITIIISLIVKDFFPAAGALLPFGFGQGTGQAMNYGVIYENDFGFFGGKSFGLSIAALGFLSAAIGGVIHLNIMKKRGLYKFSDEEIVNAINHEEIQNPDEIPMNGSIDKMSIQVAIIFAAYFCTYLLIYFLGNVVEGLKSVLYGFNFLFGVLFASMIKQLLKRLKGSGVVKKQYINPFLMNRLCGFFFDMMIVAGIAAIQIEFIKGTWGALIILGIAGAVSTYFFLRFVCKKLFPDYIEEEFLAMYGMLTGTASTGMVLLREVDKDYTSPVSDNLVYQNFPAIILGFPIMLLAPIAPGRPVFVLISAFAYMSLLIVVLFRKQLFKKNK